MHLNYYFLRQLSKALDARLRGFELISCFSQNKDELVLGFAQNGQEFYIKAVLSASFTALSFPADYHRARANSVDLFKGFVSAEVTEVKQHLQERSFQICFSNGGLLLFKLFGNRSNIIGFLPGQEPELFQHKFPKDRQLDPAHMNRHQQIDFETFSQKQGKIRELYPTFGDLPARYLGERSYESASREQQWQLVQELLQQLGNPVFRIVRLDGRLRLSLLPVGEETVFSTTDPVEAANQFVRLYLSETAFEQTYSEAKQTLLRRLHVTRKIQADAFEKLEQLQHDRSYAQTADIIMANLNNIPPQANEVELYDFYHDRMRRIPLKSSETPQKNAERLYRKAKNQQIEVRQLEERIEEKETELEKLEAALQQLEQVQDNKQLRLFLKEFAPVASAKPASPEVTFREFTCEGFRILVGKDARNNDLLTQRFTYKEDLWLHAKDVSGSHVVIKHQAGKKFPESVIEKAAQLAAYYSKRKNDSLCPVLFTPKKFVRKPKGAEPGAVAVEREKVVLVKPENPFEKNYRV